MARFDPTLTTLRHSTYFGGSLGEEILGVAVHPATGDVYVAGYTASSDLPGTLTGAQRAYAGGDDGFVARFDSTLGQLLGSTYLGGSQPDRVVAIAIRRARRNPRRRPDRLERLPGHERRGPARARPRRGLHSAGGLRGPPDPTLHTLLQATYLGGVGPDFLHAMAIHPSTGEVYVAGQTRAPDFPAVAGGANAAASPATGNTDGFVSRFDPSLTHLLQSAYVGASGSDDIFGIAIHPGSGDVYVVGWSDWADLPGAEGGAQPVMGGETDAFVTRLNASLTELLGATYLGGIDNEYGNGIAIHPTRGDVYVTGETYSAGLPGTAQGVQPDRGGAVDGFVARFDAKLSRLVQATYLGAGGDDIPYAIAIQAESGAVLAAGMTTSVDFPATAGGSQPGYAGGDEFLGGDGFVARIPAGLSAASSECVADANTLCLDGRQFSVRVAWSVPSQGRSGVGVAVPLGADTGYFWFFDDANVELVVKVLDARAINGNTWVFYGALTDVEYTITVTDTDTGAIRSYSNPSGALHSVADTAAFPPSSDAGASPAAGLEARSAEELSAMYASLAQAVSPKAAADSPCEAGGATLCLNQARFQVRVDRAVPDQGKSGHGNAVAVTPDTGYFWFFSDTNVELMVKVLDGRGINGKFWVLYGALSNVQYTITVTDTQSQTVKKYENASGALASVADTLAF